jgi:TrmH family RNA methyltransferase
MTQILVNNSFSVVILQKTNTMALSKNQIKNITSLHLKKHREESGHFIVEGEKITIELLSQQRYKIIGIYALEKWIEKNKALIISADFPIYLCSSNDMERISILKNATEVITILEIPKQNTANVNNKQNLILENIQDPGNLGTIIRTADWFGIENIFCSPDTVELYNPKVIQATMGSFLRVNVYYTDLEKIITDYNYIPKYTAVLNGQNAFEISFPSEMFLLIGNEGKGLSSKILSYTNIAVSIPKFGQAESLNAAIATAILLSKLKM